MKTLITIDPGKSSGVTVGTYSDTEPYKRTHAFQIEGGLSRFRKSVRLNEGYDWGDNYYKALQIDRHAWSFDFIREERFICPHWGSDKECECPDSVEVSETTVVCEKFTPRQALTLDAAEPLRIEGYLVGTGVLPDYVPGKKNPQWQHPTAQYFTGGEGLSDKKKRARLWRLEHGLHLTGKDVGCKDADDANSTTMHAIAYMRSIQHAPTLAHYFGGE